MCVYPVKARKFLPIPDMEVFMRLFEESGYTASGNILSREDFIPFLDVKHTKLNPARMAKIVEAAEKRLGESVPPLSFMRYRDFAVDGNRSRFEALYFARRNHMLDLAFAEIYERKGRFTEALVDAVWAMLEETTWLLPAHNKHNPDATDGVPVTYGEHKHGLAIFSASCGADLSYIYYMLKDEFDAITPEIGRRICYEVHERCIVPFLTLTPWWSGENGSRPNNWNPWIISEVLFACALTSEDMEEREAVFARAMRFADNFVDGYGEDGGCDEGPGYWGAAGFAYFTVLCIAYDMTGGKINLLSHPLVKKMGEYIPKVHIAGRYFINAADCALRPNVNGAFLRLYGERVGSSLLSDFGSMVDGKTPLISHGGMRNLYQKHLALSLPLVEQESEVSSPLTVFFRDIKIALMRECEDASKHLCFVLKGGTNGESHNHNDMGQFFLYNNGNPVIVDMGGVQYTKKTFGPERYTIMAMRSTYHSTVTVGGVEQKNGEQFASADEKFDAEGREVSMQLKGAYPEEAGIADLVRSVKLDDACVRVSDRVTLDDSREVDIHFLSPVEPQQNADGTLSLAEGVTLTYPLDMAYRVEKIAMDDPNLQSNWKRPYLYMMHFTKTVVSGEFAFEFRR